MQNEYRRSMSDGVAKAKTFGSLREKISQAGEYFDKWVTSWNQACGSLLLVGGNDVLDLMLNDLAERKQAIAKLEQKVISIRNNHPAAAGHVAGQHEYDGTTNGSSNRPRNKHPPGHMRSDALFIERQPYPAPKKVENGKKGGAPYTVTMTNDLPKNILKIEPPPKEITQKPAKKAGLLRLNSATVKNEKCQSLVDNFLQMEKSKEQTLNLQQLGVDQFVFIQSPLPRIQTFEEANLKPQLLKSIKEYGMEKLQPMQECVIPAALNGKNLICQAPPGTGKTLASAVILLQKLDSSIAACQALVIAPTKDSSDHYQADILALGESQNVLCHSCTSGTSAEVDVTKLKAKPHHIVVGTPGRLYELIKIRQVLVTDQIKVVVLEDGDKLFAPGYKEEVESILGLLPANRQDIVICSSEATTEMDPLERLFSSSPPEVITARYLSLVSEGIYQFIDMQKENTRAEQLGNIIKQFGAENVVILSKEEISTDILGFADAKTWTETSNDGETVTHTAKLAKTELTENFKNNFKQPDPANGKLNVIVMYDVLDCSKYISLLRLHPLANLAITLAAPSENLTEYRKRLEKEHGLFLVDLVLPK